MPLTPSMALREPSRHRRISDTIAHTRRLDFSDSGRIEGLCRRERVSNRCQLVLHTSDKSELDSISIATHQRRSCSLQAAAGFLLPFRSTSRPASGPGMPNGVYAYCAARRRTSRVSQRSRRCRVCSSTTTDASERATRLRSGDLEKSISVCARTRFKIPDAITSSTAELKFSTPPSTSTVGLPVAGATMQ